MRLSAFFWVVGFIAIFPTGHTVLAECQQKLPSFSEISAITDAHFAQQSNWQPTRLVTQSEVRPLLVKFDRAGWTIDDQDELLRKFLSAGDPVVRILRSSDGKKFAKQVSSYKLIYDRLDRIATEQGGQRLLVDLMKLPDAKRFAKQETTPGVPDLIDFLPKDRSGKTRRVKDYDKPTGKIYVVADLKKELQTLYDKEARGAAL